MLISTLIGLVSSGAIAGLAYRFRALSASGAVAAVVVGTALFACGSLAWYGLLLVFFGTSTGWSKWKKRQKREVESVYEKGGRRDAGQVLANGGLAALLCILWFIWADERLWYAFIGVMASVNADTWATEIGGLSKKEPISILTGKRVARGTSGGISLLGSSAAAAGAATIGIAAILLLTGEQTPAVSGGWPLLPIAVIGGLAGAFADSLLGATVQRMNRCAVCGKAVEHAVHCNKPAARERGWSWMNNDAVNVLSSLIGGVCALAIGLGLLA